MESTFICSVSKFIVFSGFVVVYYLIVDVFYVKKNNVVSTSTLIFTSRQTELTALVERQPRINPRVS